MNEDRALFIFRLPHENKIHALEGNMDTNLTPLDISKGLQFVISAFDHSDKVFAASDVIEIDFDKLKKEKTELFFSSNKYHCDSFESYTKKVNAATQILDEADETNYLNNFSKVVLARCDQKALTAQFNVYDFFEKVCDTYPSAFCYLVSSKSTGTWLGATPELLLQSEKQILQTVALASTLPADDLNKWGDKEIIEQHLVELYIENAIKNAGIPAYEKSERQNLLSGKLKHLITYYKISQNTADLFIPLLKELNPTSAVCGINKRRAKDFIDQHENLLRNFYSGYLGLINWKETKRLYVNLRCMELQAGKAYLFAGAGIVKNSIAENEWHETERKLLVLGSLF